MVNIVTSKGQNRLKNPELHTFLSKTSIRTLKYDELFIRFSERYKIIGNILIKLFVD